MEEPAEPAAACAREAFIYFFGHCVAHCPIADGGAALRAVVVSPHMPCAEFCAEDGLGRIIGAVACFVCATAMMGGLIAMLMAAIVSNGNSIWWFVLAIITPIFFYLAFGRCFREFMLRHTAGGSDLLLNRSLVRQQVAPAAAPTAASTRADVDACLVAMEEQLAKDEQARSAPVVTIVDGSVINGQGSPSEHRLAVNGVVVGGVTTPVQTFEIESGTPPTRQELGLPESQPNASLEEEDERPRLRIGARAGPRQQAESTPGLVAFLSALLRSDTPTTRVHLDTSFRIT